MSMIIAFDGEDKGQIATNNGWFQFCKVARGPVLKKLCRQGFTTEIFSLTDDLENHPPLSTDEQSIANGLIILLQENSGVEVVVVSDGFEGSNEED